MAGDVKICLELFFFRYNSFAVLARLNSKAANPSQKAILVYQVDLHDTL